MAKTLIYKYELPTGNEVQQLKVEVPKVGEVLHVGSQKGKLFLWMAYVYTVSMDELEKADRTFLVVGTGYACEMPANAKHVGTAVIEEIWGEGPNPSKTPADYVWHVYET